MRRGSSWRARRGAFATLLSFGGGRRRAGAGAWDLAAAALGDDDPYNASLCVYSFSGNGTTSSTPEATGEPPVGGSGGGFRKMVGSQTAHRRRINWRCTCPKGGNAGARKGLN
jgi:hypothetical protein